MVVLSRCLCRSGCRESRGMKSRVLLLAAALLSFALPAVAQELRIGLKTEPSSLDPQYHNLGPNNQIAQHLFDALIAKDAQQQPVPALALSWKAVGDTVWE